MAGPAVALWQNLDPNRILIAIDPQFSHPLNLTAGFALFPKGLARAAKIVCLTRIDREL